MESQTPPIPPQPLHHRQSSSQLKLWLYAVLLLLTLLFLFPYLPPLFSSSARLLRPAGLRRGWDALNLCLVLFAILCGFLGRHQDADPSPRSTDATAAKNKSGGSPRPVEIPTWLREYGDSIRAPEGATSLARRSSSSYPDLRRLAEDTRRKYYDDSDVSSCRRHSRRKPDEPGIPAASAMLVESAVAAGEQRKLLRDGPDVGSKSRRRQNNHRSSDEEASAAKARSKAAEEEAVVAAMRRKLWGDDVDAEPRSHRRRDQRSTKEDAGAAAANPVKMSKMRSSSSYPDLRDVESWNADRRFEEPEVRRRPHHRRRRSYGGENVGETVTSVDKYVVTPAPRPGPPPTPPPPPPPPPFPTIIKAYKKGTRTSAAKDIATALATFYGKKNLKKQKSKIAHSPDTGLLPSSPPPPPLPPPPPPPRATLFSLLSTKKKKLYSPPKPPPASPPPPRKPPTAARSPKMSPVDGPFAIGEGYLSGSAQSPLVPIAPPPPPPFRMEKMRFKAIGGGFVRVASGFSDVSDSDTGDASDVDPAGGRTVSAFCPSPSVDMKADTFIARTRAGFMMEKMNSIKEKQVEGGPARGRYI